MGLLADVGAALGLVEPEPARWVTIRGHRFGLDGEGRIVRGGSRDLAGVHVSQVGAYWKERRGLPTCEPSKKRPAETYAAKIVALRALLEANPALWEWLQQEWTSADQAWSKYTGCTTQACAGRGRGGRKLGAMPAAGFGGRFDALVIAWELRRRPAGWFEAVWVTIPSGKREVQRWDRLVERLPVLQDALDSAGAGFRLEPPGPALRLQLEAESLAECERWLDRKLGELAERARAGELRASRQPEGVPF